jgi:hypothetical protein
MNPELHVPCPVCGAMAPVGSQRCRYCGEGFTLAQERPDQDEPPAWVWGTDNHALLLAIGTLALPVHAYLSRFTPPYDVPLGAHPLVPGGSAAVALGLILGWMWRRRTWLMPCVVAFVCNGTAFLFMTSWRALASRFDPELLPLACIVATFGVVGAAIGGALAWLARGSGDTENAR